MDGLAQRVGAATDVQLDPPALAHARRVQLAWQQPVAQNLHCETRLAWAGVHDPASGADLQTLGSRWSVRGFDAQSLLTGPQQITWRQDLRLRGFNTAWLPAVQLQPYLGLDYGRISAGVTAASAAAQPGGVLADAAAGLRSRPAWRAAPLWSVRAASTRLAAASTALAWRWCSRQAGWAGRAAASKPAM